MGSSMLRGQALGLLKRGGREERDCSWGSNGSAEGRRERGEGLGLCNVLPSSSSFEPADHRAACCSLLRETTRSDHRLSASRERTRGDGECHVVNLWAPQEKFLISFVCLGEVHWNIASSMVGGEVVVSAAAAGYHALAREQSKA